MTETTEQLKYAAHNAGFKAGNARRVNDESLAQFETRWFQKFLAYHKADAVELRAAFDAGYRSGARRWF